MLSRRGKREPKLLPLPEKGARLLLASLRRTAAMAEEGEALMHGCLTRAAEKQATAAAVAAAAAVAVTLTLGLVQTRRAASSPTKAKATAAAAARSSSLQRRPELHGGHRRCVYPHDAGASDFASAVLKFSSSLL